MDDSAEVFTALNSAQSLESFLATRAGEPFDPNVWNPAGSTPLHVAVEACGEDADPARLAVVEILLRQFNSDVHVRDASRNTPLHIAAATGNCAVANLLLSAGADPFLANLDGRVPIRYAKTPKMEALLSERMAGYKLHRELTAEAEDELLQIEKELPNDLRALKTFIVDTLRDRGILEIRCHNELRNQIEEKQMALQKVQLLERAAGIHDRQSGATFTDQLQYMQDENEQQAAAAAYLKIRVRMLENAAHRQEEFFRKNLQDLAEQHQAQLQILTRRCSEAEENFSVPLLYASRWARLPRIPSCAFFVRRPPDVRTSRRSARFSRLTRLFIDARREKNGQRENEILSYELAVAKAELHELQARQAKAAKSPVRSEEADNAQGLQLKHQLAASEKKLAQLEAEVASLKDKLALARKMKEMSEAENADLILNLSKLRKTLEENLMENLSGAKAFHDQEETTVSDTFPNELPGGAKIVKAGTPRRLVEKLTDPTSYDSNFLQAFMLTYRLFMVKEEVLDELIALCKNPPAVTDYGSTETQQSIRVRVCGTLKYWMENYWLDFDDPEFRKTLSEFIDYMMECNVKPAILLQSILRRQESGLSAETYARSPVEGANKPKPVLPKSLQKKYISGPTHSASTGNVGQNSSSSSMTGSSVSNTYIILPGGDTLGIGLSAAAAGMKDREGKEKEKGGSTWTPFNFVKSLTSQDEEPRPIKLVDIDPLELARQLTLIEFDLFSSIQPFEFLGQAWTKEDRQVRAPNICRMAKWANHVVHWVVTEIVSVKELKGRISIYERFINLASHLNELNNFNGVKEILAALQSSAVFRLKKTRECLGQKLLKAVDDLVRSTSSELNFKNLRAKVHAAEPPVIPFPGVYCSDLVFLDTCSKSTLEGGLVNFHKFQKIASYILELQVYQQTAYALEPVSEIQDYVKEYKVFDDDEAYAQSLVCEARI